MQNKNNIKNNDFGYVIRRPFFSYDILLSSDEETFDLDKVLNNLLEDKVFLTSIYWSSPDIYNLISLNKRSSLKKVEQDKLFYTLKKYVIRATTRTTPFGTFSGCGFKSFQNSTFNSIYRKSRIDMELLQTIKNLVEKDEFCKRNLKYGINNTIYEVSEEFRYYEKVSVLNKVNFHLSSIESDSYVRKLFSGIGTKYLPINEIVTLLKDDFGKEEILEFIFKLIDEGVLMSELHLKLNLESDLVTFIKTVQKLENDENENFNQYLRILQSIENCQNLLQDSPLDYLPMQEINDIQNLLKRNKISTKHIFHIDLNIGDDQEDLLDAKFLRRLNNSLNFLTTIPQNNSLLGDQLKQFKNLFKIRYGDEEVKLIEALDNDFGIGFPANKNIGNNNESIFFENIVFRPLESNDKVAISKNTEWIMKLLSNFDKDQYSIEIKSVDNNLNQNNFQLQENFFVMGTFFDQNTFHLQSCGGVNALSILGRFSYLNEDVDTLCKKIVNDEIINNDKVIFAEIVYLPDGRTGNIARHNNFYNYEIPVFTESQADNKYQISLNDIYISIQDDEIVIRSRTLNKRIIPRLSNAHNFNNSNLSIYKFLAALQFQNNLSLGCNFNYSEIKRSFIPRITYEKIILHRATWILFNADIQEILHSQSPIETLEKVLKNKNVNRFISLINGDDEFFIDTKNRSYTSILLGELKKIKLACLCEFPFGKTTGDKPRYIKQIILPLKNENSNSLKNFSNNITNSKIERIFIPGSEWFYIKIYCSSLLSDSLLSEIFSPLLNKWVKKNVIFSGFFIRYLDPHYHVRFRFHLTQKKYNSKLLQEINSCLQEKLNKGVIWNIVQDSYVREVERYGIEYIENTEQLFYYDTLLILKLLSDSEFIENEEFRVYSAIKNIDNYLSIFNLSLQQKFQFCKEMESAFEKEFNQQIKKQVYTKYREYGSSLYNFMIDDKINELFTKRDELIKELKLNIDCLPSYVHMSINRWFVAQQRVYEYLCYAFLVKFYNRKINNC